jgi:hypothetical protein
MASMEINSREKGSLVESLWHAVSDANGSMSNVPGLVRRVIETEAWREREYRGKTYQHPNLLSFITSKPLAGCGWEPEVVEALLEKAGDAEALEIFRKEMRGKEMREAKFAVQSVERFHLRFRRAAPDQACTHVRTTVAALTRSCSVVGIHPDLRGIVAHGHAPAGTLFRAGCGRSAIGQASI